MKMQIFIRINTSSVKRNIFHSQVIFTDCYFKECLHIIITLKIKRRKITFNMKHNDKMCHPF